MGPNSFKAPWSSSAKALCIRPGRGINQQNDTAALNLGMIKIKGIKAQKGDVQLQVPKVPGELYTQKVGAGKVRCSR